MLISHPDRVRQREKVRIVIHDIVGDVVLVTRNVQRIHHLQPEVRHRHHFVPQNGRITERQHPSTRSLVRFERRQTPHLGPSRAMVLTIDLSTTAKPVPVLRQKAICASRQHIDALASPFTSTPSQKLRELCCPFSLRSHASSQHLDTSTANHQSPACIRCAFVCSPFLRKHTDDANAHQ